MTTQGSKVYRYQAKKEAAQKSTYTEKSIKKAQKRLDGLINKILSNLRQEYTDGKQNFIETSVHRFKQSLFKNVTNLTASYFKRKYFNFLNEHMVKDELAKMLELPVNKVEEVIDYIDVNLIDEIAEVQESLKPTKNWEGESKVYIEDYSAKSFIVRGDTREYRVSLKAMGGKWANGLTDKNTNERFGAWLFWSGKRKEIEGWISSGCKAVEKSDDTIMKRMEATLIRLEHRITRLEDLVTQKLDRMMQIIISGEVIEDEDEDEDEEPKRLLK